MSETQIKIAEQWNNRPKGALTGLPSPSKQMAPNFTGLKMGVPGTGVPLPIRTGDITPVLPTDDGPAAAVQRSNVWKWLVIGGVLVFLLHLNS